MSERRACAALGQHRSTQRKAPRGRTDEARLTADIVALARTFGRYGYRRITALLNEAGWDVSVSRVARIWRREGLKVPGRQPKRRRLWLADGSCIRLRPERANHVSILARVTAQALVVSRHRARWAWPSAQANPATSVLLLMVSLLPKSDRGRAGSQSPCHSSPVTGGRSGPLHP